MTDISWRNAPSLVKIARKIRTAAAVLKRRPPSGRPRCGNGPLPRNRETGPVISCILKNAQNLTAPHLSARSVSPWPLWAPGGHGGPLVRGAAAGGRGIPEWRAPDSTPGSGRNTRRRGSRSRQGTRGADAHPGGGRQVNYADLQTGRGPITMEPQFPVIPGLDIVEIAEAVGNCATVLYNEDNYAKLPEDLQTVLRECMDQIREKNNEITRDEDAYYIEKMKAEVPGLTVTESDYGSLLLWAVRSMRSWSPASLMKRSAMQSKPWPEQGRFPPCKGLVWETNGTLAENTGAPTEVKLIKKYMRHFPWPLCTLLSAGLMRDIIQPGGKCDNAPPGRAIFSLSLCRLCGKLDVSRRRTGCSRGYRSAPGRHRHLHPVEAPASA